MNEMAIKADYHLHSSFSGDSHASMENMIQTAIKKGLTHLCFTEHHDIGFPYQEGQAEIFSLNPDAYLFDLIRYKEKYGEKIHLFYGVELGIQLSVKKEMLRFVHEHDFDFIIASTHICHGKDPYFDSYYENRTEKEAFEEYFLTTLENIKGFDYFDIYGHLDYIARYAKDRGFEYSYSQYSDIIDEILSLLIEKEKGIELNTGGYRTLLSQPNPTKDILKRYQELGGDRITIGSDAHKTEQVGDYFVEAASLLKELGYKYYCVYEKRIPEYKLLT